MAEMQPNSFPFKTAMAKQADFWEFSTDEDNNSVSVVDDLSAGKHLASSSRVAPEPVVVSNWDAA
jgi:hypothetical protein